MMKHFFIALGLLLFSSASTAVTVSNLYEASVPVADKSSASQARGVRDALRQVMVKITGKRDASILPGVNLMLDNANRFLQQYEFQSVKNADTGAQQLRLWARFDSALIQNEVRQNSIPLWSQERPATLIWLLINDELGQRFAALDPDSRYLGAIKQQAAARGIEFETPLMDLQDTANLKASDLINGQINNIQTASKRYIADATLTAAVNAAGPGLWEVNWISIVEDQPRSWVTTASTASEAIAEGVDRMADILAQAYSQNSVYAAESEFEIRITGLRDFPAYANTMRYLESLNFVNQVNLQQAEDTTVTCRLTANGGYDALERAVSLGQVLRPAGDGISFNFIQ